MKTEVGHVHYFTTQLEFADREQWVKQETIPGSTPTALYRYIAQKDLPPNQKMKLWEHGYTEWKDHNGVWIKLRVETTRRNDNWPTRAELLARGSKK